MSSHLTTRYSLPVTSGYGWRRDPITGRRAFHHGIDLHAPHGAIVTAALGGMVDVTTEGPGGIAVHVTSGDWRLSYCHLSDVLVMPGDLVARGTPIGRVGSTGHSTGPHLHITTRYRGQPVDPVFVFPGGYHGP